MLSGRIEKVFPFGASPECILSYMRDELRDYRRRGLDKKIDLLTEQVLGVWVDIAIVEQGNAELSAQLRRSRFRQIND